MKLALAVATLLAAASARSGCGDGGGPAPYAPCEGKACGDRCRVCAPDDRDCFETAVVKACDPAGRCVPEAPGLCDGAAAACAGKSCGDPCAIDPPCRAATPPCMVPSVAGTCSAAGACLALGLPVPACPPHPDCVGKACGDPCNPCGPDATCPTFMASACDRLGRCVGDLPWLCYDPCAGKACGAECHACPPGAEGCAEPAVVMACDPGARCVPRTPDLVCP